MTSVALHNYIGRINTWRLQVISNRIIRIHGREFGRHARAPCKQIRNGVSYKKIIIHDKPLFHVEGCAEMFGVGIRRPLAYMPA